MKISRRALGVALTVLAIAALGGFGVYYRISGAANDADGEAGGGGAGAIEAASSSGGDISIPVSGVAAVQDTMVLSVTASGEAAASRQAVVLAQVNGRVASVRTRENDAVGSGTLIVEIDPAEYALQVEEAEANLRRAEATFRELTLFDDKIEDEAVRAERNEVARAKSGLDAARVGLEKAKLNLSRTRVEAPFAGRVASVEVVEGQWVRAGDELMTVLTLDPVRVEVQVLEADIGHLAAGRRARVSLAAFAGETFTGRVETINPMVDQETRTAKVTVRVPNPGGRILPGMYARVALDARRFAGRIMVPRSAILERDRRTMLFVYEGDERGGRAKWRYVTTGLQNDTHVEIVENPETETVRPGEIVLTDGHYTLVHDARVRLVDDVGEAGGRPN